MRVFGDILKAKKHVRALQVGDWIEMIVDLERLGFRVAFEPERIRNSIATFKVWPYEMAYAGEPESTAEFHYGPRGAELSKSTCQGRGLRRLNSWPPSP